MKKRIGLAGRVIKTGRPHFITDVAKVIPEEMLEQYPIILAENLKSLRAVPLLNNDEVIGVVLAGYRISGKMSEQTMGQFEHVVNRQFASLCQKG